MRAGRTDIDAAATARGVGDANFRHFGAEQGEDRVRVVARVFVDREQLSTAEFWTRCVGSPTLPETASRSVWPSRVANSPFCNDRP